MRLEEFDYYLPEELIAQTPLKKRDAARLMVVDKKENKIENKYFYDIIDYLEEGDALVLNDTKVLPARLIGEKEETKAVVEVLLLKNIELDIWECLCKPARRIKNGTIVSFGNGKLKMKCVAEKDEGIRHFEMIYSGIFYEILDELGTMPLPPYIHEQLKEQDMYQTVYAKEIGSAAAPTAGLHFTSELLKKIEEKNINVCYVTLHVGLGTFRPVATDNILEHKMHSEFYQMTEETAKVLNETKQKNKKIISVGTTSTRVLETIANKNNGIFKEESGWTDIFIYPGYEFKAVDSLITNFHLPKSTLIMLVSALAGKELILQAYDKAVKEQYRFFSFGDAMIIK